jgi:L-aspartate oxidase
MQSPDFLVIGSGIAGLSFALEVAKFGKVLIVTKKQAAESNTNYAQGGVAAVLDQFDDFNQHVEDTMRAGCFHNNRENVSHIVRKAPKAIYDLIRKGVEFDLDQGKIDLRLEGGHTKRRIVHAGDFTGKEIEQSLVAQVRGHSNIEILEDALAIDFVRDANEICAVSLLHRDQVWQIPARFFALATGGASRVYKFTTNPQIATGDGIAIASRIGLEISDMEFVQFHPTAFLHDGEVKFLLTEALRGEGAFLCDENAEPFMSKYSDLADLAPRDVVARAVYAQSKLGAIFLKLPNVSELEVQIKFPQIFAFLQKFNLNLAQDLIPVIPAAHFICGGIKIDIDGQTDVDNLFAFGEVANCGMHGANRLASNSLLEALVVAQNASRRALNKFFKRAFFDQKVTSEKVEIIDDNLDGLCEIQRKMKEIMWQKVGIVRRKSEMKEALIELEALSFEFEKDYSKQISESVIETRNLLICAKLITNAALKREKSLGAHEVLG